MIVMSKAYAERDGVKIEKGPGRGSAEADVYCIPCARCERIVRRLSYNGDRSYYCDYCKKAIKAKKATKPHLEIESIATKKEKAFEKAVEQIKLQVKRFGQYEPHIERARGRCEMFGSMPEAMVAIELLRLGYRVIPQQKIAKYRVDFALPDVKIVIEVDGELYHSKQKDGDREAIIQMALGLDWEIIHVPAELISKDIQKLRRVIETILQHRGKKNMLI